ncbi:hypothetical protein EVB81_100 [Rhizobium phage RHph_I46]|uniref:Uncharacterized protein n=1 Tax=Rhizobium phage RHph_I1_9 TaxID=2509729 RepID=A0A7S5UYH7_9CAUD|nr:hypothetical protein PP936_gp099 [Rhizobium phage RHph_I1_9]QIG69669.1 hypothetical protein EVB81_100 [Rhizobium phage RHph_I46]QIG70950.1 hypothetical protein EVB92_100 [Rhizobium phage RHph_I9]QIG73536.1 hypothetical protein EVC04_099 [Rhizobium phage RHph_I1_9]QIG76289.1 hypothetical protein EVC25_100 [Rhizobium phage RHph_I34]
MQFDTNVIKPIYSINELRTMLETKFIKASEFPHADIEFVYSNDVVFDTENWIFIYGPADTDEVMWFARYKSEEGDLSFIADDNASEWLVQINEVFEN